MTDAWVWPGPDSEQPNLPAANVRFWVCPEHRGGQVDWRDDVGHCLTPRCGRSSASPAKRAKSERRIMPPYIDTFERIAVALESIAVSMRNHDPFVAPPRAPRK